MTKAGLSKATQQRIVQIVERYAAQGVLCGVAQIYASLCPGMVYSPACSSLRVTLSWLVRQGRLRRQRHGRASSFFPARTRAECPSFRTSVRTS